ncbi:FISUMP domain-containing protein [Elizabethkingia sp. HX WHF]|uniref:FISUMP domain-containing protein n=1 Tax=Elizabethkingia TaxID=308865 RepID=UPI00099ABEA1|nr:MULTISPECIES: FISUMP domain-containing protein [Elizabethkingia]ATL45024.1 hypothetical protein CQS02_17770 [Elizabethkingia miricola]MCL1636786.1 fibrobacter succinogenes major paralogous domain-containing protein [Elizabethkingia bruuniana]MDX8564113.1 FISUMP domain-containing protein [Elizabethkingia sp. HX WHF]OPC18999.1 hypothetical protein BAY00_13770 [Elizabethkingia bruuniana]OPC59789.1 hypothetical protein BAY13_11090 [Elizabethkingia bruuniana]
MMKSFHLIKNSLGIAIILFLGSCRSSDSENTLTGGGVSAVSFNLLGAEYADSEKLSGQASLTKENITNSGNQVQRHSILVTPGSVITAELAPSSDTSRVLPNASSGMNSIAVIIGNPLTPGMQFRIIAYRSNGNYHTHQDYTVGQSATPMMLDNGAAYNIVVYSYGTTSLPAISSGEQNNISSAIVNYDDTNRDFMYQKLDFTPQNYTNNTLDITLRHKVAQITTIVNSGSLGNITNITGGVLTPHYSNGVVSLSSGVMSGRTILSTGASLDFSGFNTSTVTSAPVFINNNTGGNATGSFSANMTIGGITKVFNLPNSFKITPEKKSNLTINMVKCGAYIGPNTNPSNFREFMCQNLGADTSVDPFIPLAGNHGAKYQWGANTGEAGRYYSQSADQSNAEDISGWSTTTYKPDGSWSDTGKTGNDPCPTGYRVPTKAQWEAISASNNNNVERVGTPWTDSPANFASALYFRNPSNIRTLMLPIAGYRGTNNGRLFKRGDTGTYWGSSEVTATNRAYYTNISSSNVSVGTNLRANGFSVRCIRINTTI